MGKVEKVIVLSVLFLIALILVVSLTVDDPLNKTRVVEAGAPPVRATAPIVPAPETSLAAVEKAAEKPADAKGLLSTEIAPAGPSPESQKPVVPVTPPAASTVLQPVATPALPPGALLKKLDGLEDSILPDMKLYVWKEGDSYKSVAHNYYGDWQKLTLLKRSNEGRTDLQAGSKIFVPVFDTEALSMPKPEAKKAEKSGSASAPVASSSGKVHVVKDGESLWKIAKAELGNGDRWKEIYELNRDVLAKPEAVHKGQRLRIP